MVHFDFEKVRAYFDGDKTILTSFLSLVKTELLKSQTDLEMHFKNRDLHLLKESAHKLKGTALSAALPEVVGISVQLNKLVAFDEAHITGLLTSLKNETAIILSILEEKKKTL